MKIEIILYASVHNAIGNIWIIKYISSGFGDEDSGLDRPRECLAQMDFIKSLPMDHDRS